MAIRAAAQVTTTLAYDFSSVNPHDSFDHAAAWRGSLGPWSCTLEGGKLTATTPDTFASEDDARAALEPMLRAWEAAAYLRDQYEIRFVPDGSDTRDAGIQPPRDQIFRRINETYPAPDADFSMTPLVEGLMATIQRFTEAPAELPAATAELLAKVDAAVAELGDLSVEDAYAIEPSVLAALRELSDRTQHPVAGGRPAYRGPEWQWMQEALRLVTLQVGRRSTVPPGTRLTIDDFNTQL